MPRDSIVQHVLARMALLNSTFLTQHFNVTYAFLLHPTDHTLKLSNRLENNKKKYVYQTRESSNHCNTLPITSNWKNQNLGTLTCLLFLGYSVPRNRKRGCILRKVSLIYKIRQAVKWRANEIRPSSTWLKHGMCPSFLMSSLKSKAVVHWYMSFEVQLTFSSLTEHLRILRNSGAIEVNTSWGNLRLSC